LSQPIRLGILGAGSIARHHAVAAIGAGATISAACTRRRDSPNWDAFLDVAPGVRHLSDCKALLAEPGIDAIIACLSWNVMPQFLNDLLSDPRPILLEKPIALDAASVHAAIRRAGAALDNKLVGYNRRFYEPVVRLRERINQRGLKAAEVTISENIQSHVAKHGSDIVPHLITFGSSHTLDLVLHLFGPLHPVRVWGHKDPGKMEFVSYNGVLVTEREEPVVLSLNSDDPSPAGVRCRFDDGTTWHLSPLETLSIYQGTIIHPSEPGRCVRSYQPRLAETVVADARQKPGIEMQMAAFLSHNYDLGATPSDAAAVLNLIEEIRVAAMSEPVQNRAVRV